MKPNASAISAWRRLFSRGVVRCLSTANDRASFESCEAWTVPSTNGGRAQRRKRPWRPSALWLRTPRLITSAMMAATPTALLTSECFNFSSRTRCPELLPRESSHASQFSFCIGLRRGGSELDRPTAGGESVRAFFVGKIRPEPSGARGTRGSGSQRSVPPQ